MKFFLDECVSANLGIALRAVEDRPTIEIVLYRERFTKPGEKDPSWLIELGTDGGWIVISADPSIQTNPVNRRAWEESGLTAYFLPKFADRNRWIQAVEVFRWWPTVTTHVKSAPKGSGWLLPFKGGEPKRIYEGRRGR